MLHLQCGTGEATAELAELGGVATGVDSSGAALESRASAGRPSSGCRQTRRRYQASSGADASTSSIPAWGHLRRSRPRVLAPRACRHAAQRWGLPPVRGASGGALRRRPHALAGELLRRRLASARSDRDVGRSDRFTRARSRSIRREATAGAGTTPAFRAFLLYAQRHSLARDSIDASSSSASVSVNGGAAWISSATGITSTVPAAAALPSRAVRSHANRCEPSRELLDPRHLRHFFQHDERAGARERVAGVRVRDASTPSFHSSASSRRTNSAADSGKPPPSALPTQRTSATSEPGQSSPIRPRAVKIASTTSSAPASSQRARSAGRRRHGT